MEIYNIRLDEARAKEAKNQALHQKISMAAHIRNCIDFYSAIWLATRTNDEDFKKKHIERAIIKYIPEWKEI